MLITLTWGWKYGLLSALTGGCQSMWWLWGPSNGYAAFFVVPPFTLWIIWHGICANLRRKQKDHKWWLNIYAVEVPFRILSTINLYTLSRWAITLNPPPWDWASNSTNIIPLHFSNFVVIKQAVVGYIVLLLADVLLKFKFIRTFFKQKGQYSQENTGYIMSAFITFGVLFWVFDSLLGFMVFYNDISFLDLLVLNIPPHQTWARAFVIVACLIGGLTTIKMFYRQHKSDKALQESEEKFRELVNNIPQKIFTKDINQIYRSCNENFAMDFGITQDEFTGKNDYDFFPKEMADKYTDDDKRVMKKGKIENIEERYVQDGQDVWVNTIKTPLKDELGNITGILGIFWDFTERKQAEEELAKHREHLEELVKKRTKELEEKNKELERMNSLFAGREFRIKELKDKVKKLEKK